MKIKPVGDRILVKRVEPEGTSRGGIVIKKDNRVLIGKYSGTEIKFKGEDHLIVREEDVLAVIER